MSVKDLKLRVALAYLALGFLAAGFAGLCVYGAFRPTSDPLARQAALDARHRADATARKLNRSLNSGYVQEAKDYVDQVLSGYGLAASKVEVLKVDRQSPSKVEVTLRVTVTGQPKPITVHATLSRASAWKVTDLR